MPMVLFSLIVSKHFPCMFDPDWDKNFPFRKTGRETKVRVFRREEVLSEITEADRVTHLEPLETRGGVSAGGEGAGGASRWAYGLANGESTVFGCTETNMHPQNNTCRDCHARYTWYKANMPRKAYFKMQYCTDVLAIFKRLLYGPHAAKKVAGAACVVPACCAYVTLSAWKSKQPSSALVVSCVLEGLHGLRC